MPLGRPSNLSCTVEHQSGGRSVRGIVGNQVPHRGGLQSHGVVNAMGVVLRLPGCDASGERKILVEFPPVEALGLQLSGQFDQLGIAVPVVEPQDAGQFVLPAIDGPALQRFGGQHPRLVGEVLFHHRDHPRVAGGFLVLRQHLQHDHDRPPVGVLLRTDHSVRPLVIQRPIHPRFHLGDQRRIVQEVGQRQKSVEIIRSPLPSLAGAAQPG